VTNITGLSGSANKYKYAWSFSGGSPSPTSSSNASQTVTYVASGSSTTNLTVSGSGGTSTSCSRTFTVATSGGGGGDTQAPTAPSNLSATATSSSQISLAWTASSDNVGVTGYRIERCQGASDCTNFTQIATSTATNFTNSGLVANTTYRYRVRANDAAGNLSGYSNLATATTQQALSCNPLATGSHVGCFDTYSGPGTCVACHEGQARDIHKSVHYQQHGPTDYVTNIDGKAGEGPAGNGAPTVDSLIAVNTYCGTHESSPRFTCAGCHVGKSRRPPSPGAEQPAGMTPGCLPRRCVPALLTAETAPGLFLRQAD
jgi:chitodextrinase